MQVEELCARLWPAKLLVMQELFPVRNRRLWRAEMGADVQAVFGMTDKWESDLGSDLQAMGRECIKGEWDHWTARIGAEPCRAAPQNEHL